MLRYSLEGGRLLARGDLAGLRPGPPWPWVRVLALQGFSPSLSLFSCDMGTETAALRCLSGLLWAFAETEPLVQVWRGGAGSRWGALLLLSLWGCRSGALRPSGEAWGVKVVLSSLIRPYPQASGHN